MLISIIQNSCFSRRTSHRFLAKFAEVCRVSNHDTHSLLEIWVFTLQQGALRSLLAEILPIAYEV